MTVIKEEIKKVIDMGELLPSDKIVGGLKTVTVLEGKENEFESLFIELATKVRDHDKECNYYDLYKSKQSRTYLVKNNTRIVMHCRGTKNQIMENITFQRFVNY